jgi:hypothetical protein
MPNLTNSPRSGGRAETIMQPSDQREARQNSLSDKAPFHETLHTLSSQKTSFLQVNRIAYVQRAFILLSNVAEVQLLAIPPAQFNLMGIVNVCYR